VGAAFASASLKAFSFDTGGLIWLKFLLTTPPHGRAAFVWNIFDKLVKPDMRE
jgi:hypothetical protein